MHMQQASAHQQIGYHKASLELCLADLVQEHSPNAHQQGPEACTGPVAPWATGSDPFPRTLLPPGGGWEPCSTSPCDFGEKAVPEGNETGHSRKGRRETDRQTEQLRGEPGYTHLSHSSEPRALTASTAAPSRMASGRARSTRKLRNWVVEQVESGQFPGVCWDDAEKTMFRIPWKHAGKQDFREEQDAAFFKAWAVFKGKYREGDQAEPAAWKTRLRCALNKSPEFKEVPDRGHMEGPEPYKVYRLLPPGMSPDPSLATTTGSDSSGTPTAPPGTQKLQLKRNYTSLSSEEKNNGENKRSCIPNLPSEYSPLEIMVTMTSKGSSSGFQHMDDSGIGSNSNSPEPHEVAEPTEIIFQGEEILQCLPHPDADYSLLLTFHYCGHLVRKTKVCGPDFRLVAKTSESQSNMEQVVLPPASVLSEPALQSSTGHLLDLLDRGILVASNRRGLFVERLCTIPISWTGPCTPSGPGPHLLQDRTCVEVFNPTRFIQGLTQYNKGLGPPPEFQVTLNFLEEHHDPGHNHKNLITIQMEQAFARQLLNSYK